MSEFYLGLGSNLGDRRLNLLQAIEGLGKFADILAVSPLYETDPWGMADQPQFYNICAAGRTDLAPQALLSRIKALEVQLGRLPAVRWGPRAIDIDILLFDDISLHLDNLDLPHAAIANRAFVLAPLADIAAGKLHPQTGLSVSKMLAAVPLDDVHQVGELAPHFRAMRRDFVNKQPLAWGSRTYVMGILNATPDSFSGDGVLTGEAAVEAAAAQAVRFAAEGADIVDIGGESTRPGSSPVSAEEELARVLPVIAAVRQAVDLPISIDTYRASVAAACLDAGADWVNDVWGLRMDAGLAPLAAQWRCPVIIMHNRSKPKNVDQQEHLGGRYVGIEYTDLIPDIMAELEQSIEIAGAAGIDRRQIIIDPGVGFGKTVAQNLQLLDQLDQFKAMGFPVLLGSSRKSFIGYTLDLPPDQRMEGTAATVALGIDRGADIVRVHDVKEMVRIARMSDAIVRR